MSDTVVRPTFYEGEILPAGDLIATVDTSRAQLARHERYLHRWGIAAGLKLNGTSATDAATNKYVSIKLTAGIAVDGTGREIVVPADVPLNPSDFASMVNGKKDTWYPVFLSGRDESAAGTSMLTGACTSSLPTQIKENYDIAYGTPGSELSLDEQTAPGFLDGPSDGVASSPWLLLLGFVQWNPDISLFVDVKDSVPDSPVSPRYVGVNAADVVSGSGALQLATHSTGSPDAKTIMALEIHEASDGEMVFGKQNAQGAVMPVFTVTANGDLTIAGKFSSAVKPGTMQVQSGIASDGVVLPLPPGVTSATQADLHIHVTPRMISYPPPTAPALGPGDIWISIPLECFVDAARLVTCRIRWVKVTNGGASTTVDVPALCDYTIIAAVAASGG